MPVVDRLGGAIREVEVPLGQALRDTLGVTEWLDAELQLTYSVCGVATAAMQRYLENQGIVTNRLKHDFTAITSGARIEGSHVVLETDDKRVIDPTYSQYFELVGLSSQLAQQFGDMRSLLPDERVAMFPTSAHKQFATDIARRALAIRPEVEDALASRILNFHYSPPSLEGVAPRSVEDVYKVIWDMPRYAEFPLEHQLARHAVFADYVDDVLERLR